MVNGSSCGSSVAFVCSFEIIALVRNFIVQWHAIYDEKEQSYSIPLFPLVSIISKLKTISIRGQVV